MRSTLVLAVFCIFTVFAPAQAQDDPQPYFSLSTNAAVRSGEQPRIQVYTSNVTALEFRVYKVNDETEFFRTLEDLHNFGGRAAQLPRDLTPIERFHQFKTRLRSRLRSIVRQQYSADSRTVLRDWKRAAAEPPAPAPPAASAPTGTRGVTYPAVPLLNPQQVVHVWREQFSQVMGYESREIALSVPGAGLYLVEATNGELRAYTIAMVTDIAIITKTAPGRLLSFVVNRSDGKPIPGAALTILSNNKAIAQGATDANGIHDAAIDEARPEEVLVVAKTGDNFAANAVYGYSLSTDPSRSVMGYVYTDRPIYRPGHTVHFKAILRAQAGWNYERIADREVRVEVQDSDGNVVYRKTLMPSSTGTLADTFALPPSASLGYYGINIRIGDAAVSGGFQVEEYRKPEYEVRVVPQQTRLLQGESIQARIEARYYFGEPVAFGKVTYVVHSSDYWFYPREDEDENAAPYDGYAGAEILQQTTELNADGQAMVSIPTPVSPEGRDQRYRVEARVTDEGNREIAGRSFVVGTYGSFAVNIVSSSYVVPAGGGGTFTVEAKDYDNRAIQTAIRLEVREPRRRRPQETPAVLFTQSAQTDATGKATVELPFAGAGSFEVWVSATTPEGRRVTDSTYVWATGGEITRYNDQQLPIEIIPDKATYAPGEVARVLIATAVPDTHVLVTTEGQTIASYEVTPVAAESFMVDIPIRPEFAPNFFLGVTFMKNDRMHSGMKSIKVPPVEQEIVVEVQPAKPEFKPGEPAVFAVSTKNRAGRPVAAEVSLGIVDEAIYAVQPEPARDILRSFWGTRYNRTNTNSSLSYYFNGSAGVRQMRLTSIRPRSALGQLKPERLQQPAVRKAFPDTAFWVADLMTDANGQGRVQFAFPDSLTTWRATARAVTADTKVGSDIERTIVRKDVIVRLSVPRFFTEGDEVTVSTLVHNYLDTEKTATVSLSVEGLEVVEGSTRQIRVPSRSDAKLDWKVRAGTQRQVKLLAKALTDEESDAMELTLPVIPFGVKLTNALSGSLSQSGSTNATIDFPASATPSSRSLRINVTPSIAGALFGALDYLSTFPYGCTEQTMSSFLPTVMVNQALRELQIQSDVNQGALNQKVREGLARLYDFQHEDGGWGWWESDESAPFMSAYVVAGMAQARDAGINIRPDVLQRGVQWLAAEFDRSDRVVPEIRAYLLYALALGGAAEPRRVETVWNDRSRLRPYGLTLLGLALDKTGDARAAEIATQLESLATANDREAYWSSERDWLMDFDGDSSPEATALALKLLVKHRPQSPLLAKAAFWLVGNRDSGYYWSSTKQTAIVVYGLTDYLKLSGELGGSSSVRVFVDGRQVLSRNFTPQDALDIETPNVLIPASALTGNAHEIRIEKTGTGRIYWDANAEYTSTEDRLLRTGTVALNVIRDYFHLVPRQATDRIVHALQPMPSVLKPGDIIAVRLTLSGGPWRYVMAEDPIPAGTEFIRRDDLYEVEEKPAWWQSYFTRREFRDDRAVFFQTQFQGQIQYFYLLKVVNPGQFRVSPARVQPMYQPEFLSATENLTVTVNP